MSELYQSRVRKIPGSACSSENRSTVKRLFSSVFSMLDSDRDISHFQEGEQHATRIDRLMDNPVFMNRLHQQISQEGLLQTYKYPILCLSCRGQNKLGQASLELDEQDILNLALKFGQVHKIVLTSDNKEAYLFFNNIANAYICLKLLKQLKNNLSQVTVEWVHDRGYDSEVAPSLHKFLNTFKWPSADARREERRLQFGQDSAAYAAKQNKLTCRYDIQIDNEREFQVARRIIGAKGCHMKRIIEESMAADLRAANDNELLKLRLRGKGSGYKEGPEQQQSSECLHLCVSAKDQSIYSQACLRVEKLLASIYLDYADFTRKQGKMRELSIKKVVLGQNMLSQDSGNYNYNSYSAGHIDYKPSQPVEQLYRITPEKIGQLLQLRNKARRQLNFNQADRIRNYLRSVGVCLIDEKGRRGKATQVTTWKYVY